VLGNHDLHLLQAVANNTPPPPTMQRVVDASDCSELIEWLRHRPLIHRSKQINWAMVHAGLHPRWTLRHARKEAKTITKQLRSKDWQQKINPLLDGANRSFSLAIFTRSRFCSADGRFNWHNNQSNSDNNEEKPWFSHPNARWRTDLANADKHNCRVVFGHWAALGLVVDQPHVLGLDSGCVWGNRLSIARLDQPKITLFSVDCNNP